jgi:NADPH:quinone reductase-like Zn-dependent oxidoreductase
VPGGDCSGVVVELPPDAGEDLPFKVGDPVACRFRGKPMGALGEYAVVSSHTADKLPPLLTFDEGAALAGASPAVVLADRLLESKDKGGASSDAAGRLGRVLVLGARGGVGSHLIQLLKDDHGGKAGTNPGRGASYVVGVSSQPDQLRPFVESGALDEVVDYTQEDVFAMEKFRSEGSKFDLIIDLAGHGYRRLEELKNKRQDLPVKPATEGGRFVTLVPVVGPTYEIHGVLALLRIFAMPLLWKAFTSRTFHRRSLPAYTFALALPDSRECVTRTLDLARTGRLKAIVDGRGPHPFTTEGVREAFRIQESRHATGKTVVRVASPEDGGAKE